MNFIAQIVSTLAQPVFKTCSRAALHESAISHVAGCAKDALARQDPECFVRASHILFSRLPGLRAHIQDPEWHGQGWLQDFIRSLKTYFDVRNRRRLPYNVGIRAKWCTGLLFFAEIDREILSRDLIAILEDGAYLRLFPCGMEEGEALGRLRAMNIVEI